jgi:rhamnulose-1-phosphate aldolase
MNELIKQNPALENRILEVAEIAQYLWEKGWAEHNAGNISVNVHDLVAEIINETSGDFPTYRLENLYPGLAGKYFFVTGTGKRMRDLAHSPLENALLIRITRDGGSYSIISKNIFNNNPLLPTSELPTHLGIHQLIAQRGSKEKVIIHTHATELIALTQNPVFKSSEAITDLLWGMHPETMIFVPKGIGFVPYCLPGSVDIATGTINGLQSHDVVVWEKHGVFAIGDNILDTFDNIDILCKSASIYFMCRGAGFVPEGLTDEQLSKLKELVSKFAVI